MFRTITFIQANEKEWGFPLPHLLGLRFARKTPAPGESAETITLHFFSSTVKVTGAGLNNLWAKLVLGQPDREDGCVVIETGDHSYGGRPFVITEIVSSEEGYV